MAHLQVLFRQGPARPLRALAVVAALAGPGAVLAGCGTRAASPPVAHAGQTGSTRSSSRYQGLLLAVRCLREHGLPGLPGPILATVGPEAGHEILDKQAMSTYPQQAVERALGECQAALARAGAGGPHPGSGPSAQQLRDMLAFARCVRAHGVGNFPDPNSQGSFDLAGTGIDGHRLTPAELTAARACLPAAHGTVSIPVQGQTGGGSGS